MNDHLLRTFLTVREHLNFTRAAEELHLSQPAVSRQVQQLEAELEVRLFERIGKKIHLTAAGETLAEHAERILSLGSMAVEAVRRHRSLVTGTLRVGASTTPGLYFLPGIIRGFRDRYPDATVELTVGATQDVGRGLARNQFDLGFVGAPVAVEGLVLEPMVEDQIVCFASVDHPLAKRRRVAPGALTEETWVTREPGSATRELSERWMREVGIVPKRTIVAHGPEETKLLVRAGLGAAFISGLGLAEGQAGLARLRVTGGALERPISMATHVDKHLSPALQAFASAARQAATAPRRGSSARRSG